MKYMIVMVAGITLAGCATKTYGRQGELTSYEIQTMTCREIELEIAQTRGFIDHVHNESKFSGRDVLAFLGDFGIGNALEKSSAIESAQKRVQQLESLRASRRCAYRGAYENN